MQDLPTIFAVWDPEEMRGHVLTAIRIVACVVGAALGWFLASPLFRGLGRLFSPSKGMPGSVLFTARLSSACAVGAAVYFYLPLGGGFGGFGLGQATDPAKAKAPARMAPARTLNPDAIPGKNYDPAKKSELGKVRDKVEIEIGPDRNKSKSYYLVKRKDTKPEATTLEDVEKMVKEHMGAVRT